MKNLSYLTLITAAMAFMAEFLGFDVLADFAALSRFDAPIWAVFLSILAYVQWRLDGSACAKCRLWGHFVMQLSGLVLLLIGLVFVAEYPPFSHLMAVFPILGLCFIFTGRRLGDRARQDLMGCGHD